MNYFELFGLPPAPSVDKTLIAKKYFDLQKENHPDFFTQGTETEQEDALEVSAAINKGFQVFQNDEQTIEYFLQTKGLIESNEKYNLPPDFLMEMMEINEVLTEEDPGEINKRVNDYGAALFSAVRPIIETYNPAATSEADLLKLKDYYYKKKYLKRILDRLAD
jgi:molecular chaperone HscB